MEFNTISFGFTVQASAVNQYLFFSVLSFHWSLGEPVSHDDPLIHTLDVCLMMYFLVSL